MKKIIAIMLLASIALAKNSLLKEDNFILENQTYRSNETIFLGDSVYVLDPSDSVYKWVGAEDTSRVLYFRNFIGLMFYRWKSDIESGASVDSASFDVAYDCYSNITQSWVKAVNLSSSGDYTIDTSRTLSDTVWQQYQGSMQACDAYRFRKKQNASTHDIDTVYSKFVEIRGK